MSGESDLPLLNKLLEEVKITDPNLEIGGYKEFLEELPATMTALGLTKADEMAAQSEQLTQDDFAIRINAV